MGHNTSATLGLRCSEPLEILCAFELNHELDGCATREQGDTGRIPTRPARATRSLACFGFGEEANLHHLGATDDRQ